MKRVALLFDRLKRKTVADQEKGASSALAEELFYDLYKDRKRIYKINFFRGIFFGVGSVLGGTIVIAIFVWLLSLFVNLPLIGDAFQDAQDTIEQRNSIESQP
jgi:hypothetical protein